MPGFRELSGQARAAVLILGGAIAGGAGYLGWQATRPVPEAAVTDPAPAATETTSAEDPANETMTAPADQASPAPEDTAEAAPAAPALPVIDTWRVTAEGEAVVSGTATPGATVEVMVDGAAMASGEATGSGDFAILFTLPANPRPSLMWLSMAMPDQAAVLSEQRVALGPIDGPPPADAAEAADEAVAIAEEATDPPALLVTDEGAVILQDPATPDPPAAPQASVMIDTIAYTPAGEVQVGGRGAAGAALRLYVDNAEKAVLAVPATGLWVTELPDIAPGIYALRVDQLDAAGKVISRFETPFKRETLESLAVAQGGAVPEAGDATATTGEPATEPAAVALTESGTAATPVEPAPEAVASAEPEPEATAAAEPDAVEPAAPAPATPDPVTPTPVTVTVQPGFTLWGIAQDQWGDGVLYVQVFEANKDKIKNPDLIYPGQVFAMPAAATSP